VCEIREVIIATDQEQSPDVVSGLEKRQNAVWIVEGDPISCPKMPLITGGYSHPRKHFVVKKPQLR
jgi:hypothetical protein